MPLETAKEISQVGGADAVVLLVLWWFIREQVTKLTTKLEELRELCGGLKEKVEDQGDKIVMLHERVTNLEAAAGK